MVDMGWTKEGNITYYDDILPVRIPVNYHIGCMGLPPASVDFVDSIPPMVTGGNLDNARIGIGTTMYYPVQVSRSVYVKQVKLTFEIAWAGLDVVRKRRASLV